MKNILVGKIIDMVVARNEDVLFTAYETETMFEIHDSVIVSTPAVKEHGKSLLIKLPEATSWLAEPGNTLLPTLTRVFPLPNSSTIKDMQARYSNSYEMSLS
jgi:hypothetical protein